MTENERFKPGNTYYIDGNTLNGLWAISRLLSCGDRIDAGKRRDLGQWMQARLDEQNILKAPDEVAS